ncbi:hypothetical protein [Paenibacillus periandrae]|uniref:hypothetical protein n=1 Tax=Paenibacillus periandrae TaxID=1761741 RepID=UPI001F09CC94|nr:hypothetical protein [Paenibacillus periandrae]
MIAVYDDLGGFATNPGERMYDFSSGAFEDFILDVYFNALKEAKRQVPFILRSNWLPVEATRSMVELANYTGTVYIDWKFNTSHGVAEDYFFGPERVLPFLEEVRMDEKGRNIQTYDFERRWYMYEAWGRMGYNPDTPSAYWQRRLCIQYGLPETSDGVVLCEAVRAVSQVPYRLAKRPFLACEKALNGLFVVFLSQASFSVSSKNLANFAGQTN